MSDVPPFCHHPEGLKSLQSKGFVGYFLADICDNLKCHAVFQNRDEEPSEEKIQDYGFYLIDQLLIQSGKSLQHWDSMLQVVEDWGTLLQNLNPLIVEQRDYDLLEQADLAEQHMANLNPDQLTAFNKITSAITNSAGETFFLHGPSGTGKTYLYNTLCYQLCIVMQQLR
jgi:primosomal protein N'